MEFGGVGAINPEDDIIWFESRAYKNCKKIILAICFGRSANVLMTCIVADGLDRAPERLPDQR